MDIELGNSAPLDDVITASKTAEQHLRFRKQYGEPNDESKTDGVSNNAEDDAESKEGARPKRQSCWKALCGIEKLEDAPPFSAYNGIMWMHLTFSLILLVGLLVSIIFV